MHCRSPRCSAAAPRSCLHVQRRRVAPQLTTLQRRSGAELCRPLQRCRVALQCTTLQRRRVIPESATLQPQVGGVIKLTWPTNRRAAQPTTGGGVCCSAATPGRCHHQWHVRKLDPVPARYHAAEWHLNLPRCNVATPGRCHHHAATPRRCVAAPATRSKNNSRLVNFPIDRPSGCQVIPGG